MIVDTKAGIWQVVYNGENRPASWTCGTTNLVMSYDHMGRRVEYVETVADPVDSTIATNKHQRFVYDKYLCVQRLNGTNNAVTDLFEWVPTEPIATRPLALQKYGEYNLFYTHDGNKNVSELVFSQQANGIAAHYEYTPFGAVTATSRSTPVTAYDFREYNPFRFSAEYADDETGLVYYNYRHYNPMDGRWTSRDLIGESDEGTLFSTNNDLIDASDYLGLKLCYRWMLITFYTGQKPKAGRNSWNKEDLNEFSAAVGLKHYKYDKQKKRAILNENYKGGRGRDAYAYPPLTNFTIYRGRKGKDNRTVRDGGSGWTYPRIAAPNGVGVDEWLDLWTASITGRGIEIDLVSIEIKDECPCPEKWSEDSDVVMPQNLKSIKDAINEKQKPRKYIGSGKK